MPDLHYDLTSIPVGAGRAAVVLTDAEVTNEGWLEVCKRADDDAVAVLQVSAGDYPAAVAAALAQPRTPRNRATTYGPQRTLAFISAALDGAGVEAAPLRPESPGPLPASGDFDERLAGAGAPLLRATAHGYRIWVQWMTELDEDAVSPVGSLSPRRATSRDGDVSPARGSGAGTGPVAPGQGATGRRQPISLRTIRIQPATRGATPHSATDVATCAQPCPSSDPSYNRPGRRGEVEPVAHPGERADGVRHDRHDRGQDEVQDDGQRRAEQQHAERDPDEDRDHLDQHDLTLPAPRSESPRPTESLRQHGRSRGAQGRRHRGGGHAEQPRDDAGQHLGRSARGSVARHQRERRDRRPLRPLAGDQQDAEHRQEQTAVGSSVKIEEVLETCGRRAWPDDDAERHEAAIDSTTMMPISHLPDRVSDHLAHLDERGEAAGARGPGRLLGADTGAGRT